jgi:hypothetical protein
VRKHSIDITTDHYAKSDRIAAIEFHTTHATDRSGAVQLPRVALHAKIEG